MTNHQHEITVDDYFQAAGQVEKAAERRRKGKELSKKEHAILVLAADVEAARRRVDAVMSVVRRSRGVPQINPDTIVRIRSFHRLLEEGLRVANERQLLVGEVVALKALLSDLETMFEAELEQEDIWDGVTE